MTKLPNTSIEKEMYHTYDIKEQVSQDLQKMLKEAMKIGK